jgi:hypothetical protein
MKQAVISILGIITIFIFVACSNNKKSKEPEEAAAPPPSIRYAEVVKTKADSMIKFFNRPGYIPSQNPDLTLAQIPKATLLSKQDMQAFTQGNNLDTVRFFSAAYLPGQQPQGISFKNTTLVQIVDKTGGTRIYKYYDLRFSNASMGAAVVPTNAVCPLPADCSTEIN